MCISDWSSDVCSSDLDLAPHEAARMGGGLHTDALSGAHGRLLCERAALLPEIYHAVVADDLLLDLRVLIGEDDQVVGVRVPGARHPDAVRSQKGAGLGDLLRAGIFLFPLQIGRAHV